MDESTGCVPENISGPLPTPPELIPPCTDETPPGGICRDEGDLPDKSGEDQTLPPEPEPVDDTEPPESSDNEGGSGEDGGNGDGGNNNGETTFGGDSFFD